ncbi:hypothetical protein DSI66_12785, partial [Mycobacterium tuberculosis]
RCPGRHRRRRHRWAVVGFGRRQRPGQHQPAAHRAAAGVGRSQRAHPGRDRAPADRQRRQRRPGQRGPRRARRV